MKPIARRGNLVAWAAPDFDPAVDEVELRVPGEKPRQVRWQSVLKLGYWEEINES